MLLRDARAGEVPAWAARLAAACRLSPVPQRGQAMAWTASLPAARL
ncbi:MAG TPA: hypothetical protein VKV80_16620 [Streptosporangiaceae bacterium]|nr:hypothetical protein [Streptosporangiaceae bacterium]